MRAYLSRTSAPTPVLIRAANGFQIILGKVRPNTSPGREPSTSSDHCSFAAAAYLSAYRSGQSQPVLHEHQRTGWPLAPCGSSGPTVDGMEEVRGWSPLSSTHYST